MLSHCDICCCLAATRLKLRLSVAGNCKAVVGRADSDSSHPKAVDLTIPEGMQPRATSETLTAKGKGHGVRQMTSMPMPMPFAEASLSPLEMPERFLGRGQLGERPSAPPLMTMHQLGSHDQFVVRPCCATCAFIVYDLSNCILSCQFYHCDSSPVQQLCSS